MTRVAVWCAATTRKQQLQERTAIDNHLEHVVSPKRTIFLNEHDDLADMKAATKMRQQE